MYKKFGWNLLRFTKTHVYLAAKATVSAQTQLKRSTKSNENL